MSVPIHCPDCGEFCGEVAWSPRYSQFKCTECGLKFKANGTDGIKRVE